MVLHYFSSYLCPSQYLVLSSRLCTCLDLFVCVTVSLYLSVSLTFIRSSRFLALLSISILYSLDHYFFFSLSLPLILRLLQSSSLCYTFSFSFSLSLSLPDTHHVSYISLSHFSYSLHCLCIPVSAFLLMPPLFSFILCHSILCLNV